MRKFFLFTFLLPFLVQAQDIASKADALLMAYHTQGKFTGTVLIAKEGKIIFEKGYGYADIQNKVPNSSKTEFRIGSLSKPFTATIIMQLQEKGQLTIKDPIQKYLPDYPKGDSILIENLLSHTSGIKSLTSMKEYYEKWIATPSTLEQTIGYFKNEPLNFSPGTRFEYSNSNYILLSYIAEKVSGTSFSNLLQNALLKKIKLQHSGLDQNSRISKVKAIGYDTTPTDSFALARYNDMSVLSGAGAMYSTARDLYLWDRALYTNMLLSDASKKLMFTPVQNNYGLGWEIRQANGRTLMSHSGSIDGFLTNFMRFPDQDVCIIFLANYFQSKGPQISKALTAIVFNEPYEMPKQRKAIALADSVLTSYAGHYQMEKGPQLLIVFEEGKLKGKLGNQPYFEMLPEAKTKFYIKGIDGDVEFIRDENQNVIGVNLTNGKTVSFKRLPAAP
ncbi:MAG TPA: serine hydrolase [Flavisolibacter sp.]|nr:serine hydrolase [Flavisolibacter sp.]